MDIKIKIGLRIKEIRVQQKLTQEAVAWKSDIDRTYMNHVENGHRNISIESLEKIITGLEITFKEFFDHELFLPKAKKKGQKI
jgi:transcriptional regulator with XRE-family HTH domain